MFVSREHERDRTPEEDEEEMPTRQSGANKWSDVTHADVLFRSAGRF